MEFPKDEVKDKVIWTKGADFTDGSPRYTFEGRDPATTYERFQVVIYTERERRYTHDPGSLCNHYYGYVRDDKMECAETIGPYYSVRERRNWQMVRKPPSSRKCLLWLLRSKRSQSDSVLVPWRQSIR